MLKSKNISAYFKAKLKDLKPGVPLEFSVYLYFPASDHVLAWLGKGEEVSPEFLAKYEAKGLKRIWIHKDEKDAFRGYRRAKAAPKKQTPVFESLPVAKTEVVPFSIQSEPVVPPESPVLAVDEPDIASPSAKVEDSEPVVAAPETVPLAIAAQALIRESLTASDPETQKIAHQNARKAVHEILADIGQEAHSMVSEAWKAAQLDPAIDHAANVATYTVMLALAFGRIDPGLISDLALAGLLHDIGVTQLPIELAQAPWDLMDESQRIRYGSHVSLGLELAMELAPELPERVRAIIAQHHEKFDGTGHDGVSQLLALVELLDSVASGQYDGRQRTYREALDVLERLESESGDAGYFNPEVFSAVLTWVRGEASDSNSQQALGAVRAESERLMKKAG